MQMASAPVRPDGGHRSNDGETTGKTDGMVDQMRKGEKLMIQKIGMQRLKPIGEMEAEEEIEEEWKDIEGGEQEPVTPTMSPRGGSREEETSKGLGQDDLRDDPGVREGDEVKPKKNRTVETPTREQVEDHERTHCPYQPWCRHCVMMRGRNRPHYRKAKSRPEEGEACVPKISMDYFFMSKEDEATKKNPMIVMVDEQSGDKYARATGVKGTGHHGELDWLIKDMTEELKAWGHAGGTGGHIILKSDNEASVVALREAVGRLLGGKVVPESPPRGESQSNGRVEEAGKTTREFVKVLKSLLEEKLGEKIKPDGAIVQWLIRWAAMLPSRFLRGKDGKTPYQRRRGAPCDIPTEIFGEKVWYKELHGKSEHRDKMKSDWKEGLWLGHSRNSNEVVIGTKSGVVKAWAIKKKPPSEQWDIDLVNGMMGTPGQPDPTKASIRIPIRVNFDDEEEEERADEPRPMRVELYPRAIYIQQWMVEAYGYTEGCAGCDSRRAGLTDRKQHSTRCRERMMAELEKDPRGKMTRDRADERWRQWAVREAERHDREKAQEEAKDKASSEVDQAASSSGIPQAQPCEAHQGAHEQEFQHEAQPEGAHERERHDQEAKPPGEGTSSSSTCPMPAGSASHAATAGTAAGTGIPKPLEDLQQGSKRRKGETLDREMRRRLQMQADKRRREMVELEAEKKRRMARSADSKRAHEEEEQRSDGMPKRPRDEGYEDAALLPLGLGGITGTQNVGESVKKILTVKASDKVWDTAAKGKDKDEFHEAIPQAWDDITGVELDPRAVRQARLTEIGYAKKKNVWSKIKRSVAEKRGWKIVKTKWIDTNKGDAKTPVYRSRFVAKEFNTGDADGLFAATPPLEALRTLLSITATKPKKDEASKTIMINDVSRAFFEAPMQEGRNICIELPEEDLTEEDKRNDMVGYLNMSLYGTRDAAYNFQKEVRRFMLKCGFKPGRYNPCTFVNKARGLATLIHGDDFVTSGGHAECDWFREQLEKRFEIKSQLVGEREDEQKEARILNRVIRVTAAGWEMEADQRHVDLIVQEMNLVGARGVSTPGEEEKRWEEEDNRILLDGPEARRYREVVARANYLAQDRFDLQFAVKEACRGMCNPCRGDVKKLRRIARYLIDNPRLIVQYRWQAAGQGVRAYTDSDFAGCRRTAKSTSGGVIFLGEHYLRSWSSTQKTVALSSGEAELTAVVKCSCEAIGILQLAQDWNLELEADVYVDSSAALGVVARRGAGRLRHVRVGQLWVQEVSDNGDLRYGKVRGTENPADGLTKYVTNPVMSRYLQMARCILSGGRADSSLEVAR